MQLMGLGKPYQIRVVEGEAVLYHLLTDQGAKTFAMGKVEIPFTYLGYTDERGFYDKRDFGEAE